MGYADRRQRREECEETSNCRGSAEAGGIIASTVDDGRGLRAAAEQQHAFSCCIEDQSRAGLFGEKRHRHVVAPQDLCHTDVALPHEDV